MILISLSNECTLYAALKIGTFLHSLVWTSMVDAIVKALEPLLESGFGKEIPNWPTQYFLISLIYNNLAFLRENSDQAEVLGNENL